MVVLSDSLRPRGPPGFPVHCPPESAQTRVCRVDDALRPPHPPSPPRPAFSLPRHQALLRCAGPAVLNASVLSHTDVIPFFTATRKGACFSSLHPVKWCHRLTQHRPWLLLSFVPQIRLFILLNTPSACLFLF